MGLLDFLPFLYRNLQRGLNGKRRGEEDRVEKGILSDKARWVFYNVMYGFGTIHMGSFVFLHLHTSATTQIGYLHLQYCLFFVSNLEN